MGKYKGGIACKVCKRHGNGTTVNTRVCKDCLNSKSTCPICKSIMSKYTVTGKLKLGCSKACVLAVVKMRMTPIERSIVARTIHHKKAPTTHLICSYCGIQFERNTIKVKGKKHHFCSPECHQSIGDKGQRYSVNYRNWRIAVFQRDNWMCQDCGQKAGRLHAHHIQEWALNKALRFDVSNGQTLCPSCHHKRHFPKP